MWYSMKKTSCDCISKRVVLNQDLDSKTTGPMGFTGPVGKQSNDCEKLQITEFDAIPSPDIDKDDEELSTDQKYLAVSSGSCSSALAARNPGKMAHSRWLTTAKLFLSLYVSTSEPSSTFNEIVPFIMTVYAPIWFKIKKTPTMPQRSKTIANKVLHRNSFFAHPENILMFMRHGDEHRIRELGWRILKARSKQSPAGEIRAFAVPKLIYDSQNYFEMINWQMAEVTEPTVTKTIPDARIKEFVETGEPRSRLIKLVTEASASVSGIGEREGFIHSRLHSRTKIPRFDSKKDY
ncbi:hypothetical protein Hamer_G007414, partial [Homarus americanus]